MCDSSASLRGSRPTKSRRAIAAGLTSVMQEGYDPEDMKMIADEFVLGRSGKWLSLGHFYKMPVPDRRAEYVFGTAAEVMQMMSEPALESGIASARWKGRRSGARGSRQRRNGRGVPGRSSEASQRAAIAVMETSRLQKNVLERRALRSAARWRQEKPDSPGPVVADARGGGDGGVETSEGARGAGQAPSQAGEGMARRAKKNAKTAKENVWMIAWSTLIQAQATARSLAARTSSKTKRARATPKKRPAPRRSVSKKSWTTQHHRPPPRCRRRTEIIPPNSAASESETVSGEIHATPEKNL